MEKRSRDPQIGVPMSDEEKHRIERAAIADGRSVAGWCRWILTAAANQVLRRGKSKRKAASK